MEPGLYVVATPIGNLGDISPRALDVLRGVDLVAAEDTRHSSRMLAHFGIGTPLTAYHDHSDGRSSEKIERCLLDRGSVALISDAGTPLVSDPGFRLVRRAHEQDIAVRAVPGPCAAVAALSVSGLATDRFLFEGFLPAKSGARDRRLEALAGDPATLIFYEAPHRVVACLASLVEVFGAARQAMLAREITKTFETVKRATLGELLVFVESDTNQQRGEIVLVVAGKAPESSELPEAARGLLLSLAGELPPRRAAAIVAQYTGVSKKRLYQILLDARE